MANLASLYELVLPYLPGAEVPVVQLHARRVLREFLRRTTVWRERVTFNTALPGVGVSETYRYAPTSGEVAATLAVYVDGSSSPLPVATEATRANHRLQPAPPRGWYSNAAALLSFWPQPDAVYAIEADVTLVIPIMQSAAGDDTFPDDVFAEYGEDIAAGVIGYMMAMPGKPWTQMEAGQIYLRRYENRIRSLRGRLRDGGQPNASTMHGPRIVGGR